MTKKAARHAKKRGVSSRAPVGRVHLLAAMSLDGYIASPDGGYEWLEPYADARAGYGAFMKTIGSAVMGRTTYDKAVDQGHTEFGGIPTYVVTHRPFVPPSPDIIPYSGELGQLVEELRERHPRDIWLMGGGILTNAFREADLIDLWSIAVIPTVLGAGLPMFPPMTFGERRLRLVHTRKYPSGVVALGYERR